MIKYSVKDLKNLAKDGQKEKNETEIESSFFYVHVDKENRGLYPTAVISTSSLEELSIQFNPNTAVYTVDTPSSDLNFKKINNEVTQSVTNKNIQNFITNVNKSAKGCFVSGDQSIDSYSEEKIADIINAASSKNSFSVLENLEIINDELRQAITEESQKAKKKNPQSTQSASIRKSPLAKNNKVKAVAPADSISEDDYPEFARLRTLNLNKSMDSLWRGLKYDRKNDIQQEIIERFGEGQSIMLMGDTGIGKTFNPEFIAETNGLSAMTVKLHRASDSVELLGKPSFRANAITGEQEMYFDTGFLTNAFRQASLNAHENGKGFVLILDEILRADDMTPFVSNLSINRNDEYVLSIDDSNTFAKIDTDRGELWFHVSDDINRDKQSYSFSQNSGISMNSDTNSIYCFNGGAEQAAERHFRNDLLSIHREDFRVVVDTQRRSIAETHSEKTKIYTPSRAVSIVGTTNIGENYEVNMMTDNALLSRLNPVLTTAPKISYMVDKTIEKVAESKEWTLPEQKMMKKIITNFSTALSKVFKNNKSIENPQKINFRILNDIVGGIAPQRPFADGKWNVEAVLKRSAIKFLSIDSSLTAEEIKKDPILEAVVRGAEQAVELSNNPAFKGVLEEGFDQEAPATPDEDDEPSITPMKP